MRRGLRDNNITTERIARDAEQEGNPERARRVRQEMQPYRSTGVLKKSLHTGKIRKFKNLSTFNQECSKQGSSLASKAMVCELQSIRRLHNGEGIASVKVRPLFGEGRKQERSGTWRLHFGSFDILKKHLQGRVTAIENGRPTMNAKALDGHRSRRRR